MEIKKTLPDYLREAVLMTVGTLLVVIGIYFFKFPNNFSTGGVSGISVILGRLITYKFVTPGAVVFIINSALLIVGFAVFGRGFGFKTAYCSMLMSVALWALEYICPMDAPFTDEPLLELCYAVIFPAIGSAILFNINATTGGTDIIAMILRKYSSLDIGKSLACVDILIVISNAFVFGIKTGLFSALGLLSKALIVDSVIENINLSKYFIIVTEKPDEICEYITKELNRSGTVWKSVGAYTHHEKTIILVAMKRAQAAKLRVFVKATDPNAFIVISNTSDIIGKGFRTAVTN
jgi:uncharacterized membrane-anchored protein YitT (DUF2179 family)